jgi:fibro-slime domain-containing protein
MATSIVTRAVALAMLSCFFACSPNNGGGSLTADGGSGGTAGSGGKSSSSSGGTKTTATGSSSGIDISAIANAACGDGTLTSNEACDDGNTADGDGCSANCLTVDPGYSCMPAGMACHKVARCGDEIVVLPEQCDDGNTAAGDGCSSDCKLELGYKCDASPSVCSPTKCGDGKQEGAEGCDDGNTMPYDGCSEVCQSEPECSSGVCTSTCGDGIMLNEQCDDGNIVSGDGCSSDCKIEPGYQCTLPQLGDTMKVPMVVRDFNKGGDFEKGSPFDKDLNYANQQLVKDKLQGTSRKPALASPKGTYNGTTGQDSGIASAASFAQWYDDAAPASGNTRNGAPLATTLNLYLKDDGSAYVNRFGKNGDGLTSDQYRQTITQQCGEVGKEDHDSSGNALPCTACYYNANADKNTPCTQHDTTACQTDKTYSGECTKDGTAWKGLFVKAAFDGNPLFFPADALKPYSPSSTAQISGNYDSSWPADPTGKEHNFSFTTEVRYWFEFDSSKTYQLRFIGDDDVWVFINNTLVVDLGGIHTAVQGDLTIKGGSVSVIVTPTNVTGGKAVTTKPNLGLVDGNVYEVAVFNADRQTKASDYQLTLSGFMAAASDCRPVCGDGILGMGEECDDGENAGGYGKCAPGCKIGEYCGDGAVQSQYEDCDDGKNVGAPCPSGCHYLTIL